MPPPPADQVMQLVEELERQLFDPEVTLLFLNDGEKMVHLSKKLSAIIWRLAFLKRQHKQAGR